MNSMQNRFFRPEKHAGNSTKTENKIRIYINTKYLSIKNLYFIQL